MSTRIFAISGALAILMATSAIAYTSAGPATTQSSLLRDHRRAGARLPKELKMLWRREEHARLKAMPKEQRKGWLKARWASMSDQQKNAKFAELQKKWDSLPESVRQRMLERKREKREARRMHREQGGRTSRDSARPLQQQ
jgi:hypothetical protein